MQQTAAGLCCYCIDSLPCLPTPHCLRCARPLLHPEKTCDGCPAHSSHLDALHAAYLFDYPLDALIHAFKYAKKLELAHTLGTLLAARTGKIPKEFDRIVAVPLSKERLAFRGFNQSEELLHYLINRQTSRSLTRLCWRKCNTPSQALLPLAQRQQNMHNVFGVNCRIDGLSVAIIDDVATTLATLFSLASALKNQGAKRVEAWVLARAITHKT